MFQPSTAEPNGAPISNVNAFPEYVPPTGSLCRNDVESYLSHLVNNGYSIYRHVASYIVALDPSTTINIDPNGDLWNVGYVVKNIRSTVGSAMNVGDLRELLDKSANHLGHNLSQPPSTGRLIEAAPISNYQTISNLLAGADIEAVFDPYLDNASLGMLITILSFGSSKVANTVRLLGSSKTTGGNIPRFTRVAVDAFFTQLGITGETRLMASTTEHRRFLLLSGGRSLILGPSLNAIHKNEAAHTESDALDHPFFDSQWTNAQPLT